MVAQCTRCPQSSQSGGLLWPFDRKSPTQQRQGVGNDSLQALSLLRPDEVSALGGLPSEAIAGTWPEGQDQLVDSFRTNPRFVEFLHHVIAMAGPSDPGLMAAAVAQKEGWVYMIDARTPDGPQGRVPPEDIIGAFEVRGGVLVPGGYQAMASHRVFTANGLVSLSPRMRSAFVQALRELVAAGSAGGTA